MKIDMKNIDFVNNKTDQNSVLDEIEDELVNLGKLTKKEVDKLKQRRHQ